MTNLQEAKLAREAELCYATMAMVTDYDVWYEGEEDVTLEQVLEQRPAQRRDRAGDRPPRGRRSRPRSATARCRHAVEFAINTPAELIPPATKQKLDLLIGKYLG